MAHPEAFLFPCDWQKLDFQFSCNTFLLHGKFLAPRGRSLTENQLSG